MSQQCPLLFRQVDATVVRINTFFVTAGVVTYLVTHASAILVFLMADFALRLYGFKHLSPIQRISSIAQKALYLPVRMEDAGAKRLAAFFGLGFIAVLEVAHVAGLEVLGLVVAAIYLACAVPYLLFGYCVGCQVYYVIKKIYPKAFS
ncbi:MAG: DUF4395 domain-containing protein [Sulfuricurvum sp.]